MTHGLLVILSENGQLVVRMFSVVFGVENRRQVVFCPCRCESGIYVLFVSGMMQCPFCIILQQQCCGTGNRPGLKLKDGKVDLQVFFRVAIGVV